MNIKRLSLLMSMIFLLSVMLINLTACSNTGVDRNTSQVSGSETANAPTIKITFNSCGGSDVAVAETEKNGAIPMPVNPEWKSYTFAGWYTDKDYTTEFVNGELDTDATVYAKWTNDSKTVRTQMLDLYEIDTDMSDASQGWEWNQAARTLTLSSFTLDSAQIDEDGSSVGIVFPHCPNQALDDMEHIHTPDCPTNTLILTDGTVNTVDVSRAINEYYSTATYSASPLIIKTSGSGTPGILNSTAAQSKEVSTAVYATGDITVESGNVTATAGDSLLKNSTGIGVYLGNIYIKNGTITAIGGKSGANPSEKEANGSFGLHGAKIQIDNGTVTATGGTSKTALSTGIMGKQGLMLGGGSITALGDTAAVASFAELTLAGGILVNGQDASIMEIKNADSKGHSLHTFVDDQNAILKNITITP